MQAEYVNIVTRAQSPGRGLFDQSVGVSDTHARYQEAVLRGNVYLASAQAGIAVTALNATATGFILSNTAGSGVNLVLWEVGFVQTSTAATTANAAVGLAANVNIVAAAVIHTTPLTVRNALLGGPSKAQGLADSSATLPASPVLIVNLWQPSVSASATTAIPPVVIWACDGKIILTPGTAVSLTAASALSGIGHMVWEEVPASA